MDSVIPANGTKRVRPGRRLSLRQVVELQDIAFQAARGLITDFQETSEKEERARVASAISNLAKGWVSLQDAKREILGKPKAGVRKHAVEKKPKPKPYWLREPQYSLPEPEPKPIESSERPDEVKWEMREGPPGVFTQVVLSAPGQVSGLAPKAPSPQVAPKIEPLATAPATAATPRRALAAGAVPIEVALRHRPTPLTTPTSPAPPTPGKVVTTATAALMPSAPLAPIPG